ncbi:hypothetical protein V8F20_006388 [Naviculisporaceae sp. PSN 640]
MPDSSKLNEIAHQAEIDLNKSEAKTGHKHRTGLGDTGVDDIVEKKFPGATVHAGDNNISSRSYNRKIPPEEGGDLDERGRPYHGSAYETTSGTGGPIHAHGLKYEEPADPSRPDYLPRDAVREEVNPSARSTEPMERGKLASESNRAGASKAPHPHPYRGADWEAPEGVPDEHATMGTIPPESVTETSKIL